MRMGNKQPAAPPKKPQGQHILDIRKMQNADYEAADGEDFEQARSYGPPTEILEHLYLGSKWNAQSEAERSEWKITHILNVAEECKTIEFPKYSRLIVNDFLEKGTNQYPLFRQAYDFIDEALQNNARCLVHCARGRSRSVTIVIGYLMERKKMPLREAYLHVKRKRPIIGPHYALRSQLVQYEHDLFGKQSLTSENWVQLDKELRDEKRREREKTETTEATGH